ncbi:MAG: aminodeoxychorismate/anthranilate synthase component II [Alphaproteobacteria bacterium]|nr:aminodeoxychorismate/anthranilate synthase component II [Alphaproteobacteria bacterium]
MFLLIDNYDSFTYNLVHYLGELGCACAVHRNDKLDVAGALALAPEAIVISPGPSVPDNAGICLDLVAAAAERKIPVLGVCLGHQTIGQAFGATVAAAPEIMHGKVSPIHHQGSGLFDGLPNPLLSTRYHSLIVDRKSLPDCLTVTAEIEDSGIVMGLAHQDLPIFGVQFHPESIASQSGHALLANFIALATGRLPEHIPEPARVVA